MSPLIALGAVGIGTAVIFGYLAVIWWLDRYDREPLWLVGLVFAWGAFGGTCFGCTFSLPLSAIVVELFGAETGTYLTPVVVAPVVEEMTKALVFIPLFFSKHFDNETDGLIYGAAAGLGFAVVENLLYYSAAAGDTEGLIVLVILRTALTAIVHCVSSACIGVAFGFAKHRAGALSAILIVAVGYALGVINHGVWNAIATEMGVMDQAAGWLVVGSLLVACAGAFMFTLTQYCLWREHKMIARVLRDEAALGTIPLAHAGILPFWLRRWNKDWVPRHVDRKRYVKLATRLAFRIHQSSVAGERAKLKIDAEIAELRGAIQQMLAGAL